MNELEVQAYITGWDDAIKLALELLNKGLNLEQLKQELQNTEYYRTK